MKSYTKYRKKRYTLLLVANNMIVIYVTEHRGAKQHNMVHRLYSAVSKCENISHLDTNMPMCILLRGFLHFKKMPRHKYFTHLIIQGGPKMHFYIVAQ